jgi:hypothetical protein
MKPVFSTSKLNASHAGRGLISQHGARMRPPGGSRRPLRRGRAGWKKLGSLLFDDATQGKITFVRLSMRRFSKNKREFQRRQVERPRLIVLTRGQKPVTPSGLRMGFEL